MVLGESLGSLVNNFGERNFGDGKGEFILILWYELCLDCIGGFGRFDGLGGFGGFFEVGVIVEVFVGLVVGWELRLFEKKLKELLLNEKEGFVLMCEKILILGDVIGLNGLRMLLLLNL